MKINFKLLVFISIICFSSTLIKAQCTLSCNITSGYICPKSNLWKLNLNLVTDADFMENVLQYKKDKDGCWVSQGSKTVEKKGDKNTLQKLYLKFVNLFGASNVKKTGF